MISIQYYEIYNTSGGIISIGFELERVFIVFTFNVYKVGLFLLSKRLFYCIIGFYISNGVFILSRAD